MTKSKHNKKKRSRWARPSQGTVDLDELLITEDSIKFLQDESEIHDKRWSRQRCINMIISRRHETGVCRDFDDNYWCQAPEHQPPFGLASYYRHKLNSANGHRPSILAEIGAMDDDRRSFIVSSIANNMREYLDLEDEIDNRPGTDIQTTLPFI